MFKWALSTGWFLDIQGDGEEGVSGRLNIKLEIRNPVKNQLQRIQFGRSLGHLPNMYFLLLFLFKGLHNRDKEAVVKMHPKCALGVEKGVHSEVPQKLKDDEHPLTQEQLCSPETEELLRNLGTDPEELPI